MKEENHINNFLQILWASCFSTAGILCNKLERDSQDSSSQVRSSHIACQSLGWVAYLNTNKPCSANRLKGFQNQSAKLDFQNEVEPVSPLWALIEGFSGHMRVWNRRRHNVRFRDESWWMGEGWADEGRLFVSEEVEEDVFKRAVNHLKQISRHCRRLMRIQPGFFWPRWLLLLVTLKTKCLSGNKCLWDSTEADHTRLEAPSSQQWSVAAWNDDCKNVCYGA